MSNILIIKHGSLGDLIQANGAIKDIKNFYPNRKVFLLTTQPYSIFMSECPYLDGVLIDNAGEEFRPTRKVVDAVKVIVKEATQQLEFAL